MSDQSPRLDLQRYDSTSGIGHAQRVWPCYDEVFGDFDDFEPLSPFRVPGRSNPLSRTVRDACVQLDFLSMA